jgi:Tol biopolymer transport system component
MPTHVIARRALTTVIVAGVAVLGSAGLAAAAATLTGTQRVNVSTGGAEADAQSLTTAQAVSGDGRYVVFESAATTLVTPDTNGVSDIFLRDTVAATTTRVSLGTGGAEADGGSGQAVISSDGAWVAFSSDATNLVAGDANGGRDVFVYEVASGAVTRVSVSTGGAEAGGGSDEPSLSADGRLVVFSSPATDLIAGDGNAAYDVFVRDRVGDTTTRVSLADDESEANAGSFGAAISGDGRFVSFASMASNLLTGGADANGFPDVFRRDIAAGVTILISVSTGGVQADFTSNSRVGGISADGSRVTFTSGASNLGPDADSDGDAFVRDVTAGTTTLVSVASDGTTGDGSADESAISDDGAVVAFRSDSSNVVPGFPATSGNVYIHRIATAETTIVSQGVGGTLGNDGSYTPALSSDGLVVAFGSGATNLVAGDTNLRDDVFLATLADPTAGGGGGAGAGPATHPPTGTDAATAVSLGAAAAGLIFAGVVAVLHARRRQVALRGAR